MRKRKSGRRWKAVRRRALERDGYRCQHCGKAGYLEVDHVVRIEDGGPEYDLANLQALCRGCHVAKTNAERGVFPTPEPWKRLVDELRT